MNLLNADASHRDAFETTVATLVAQHGFNVNELFMNVLESQAEPQMNYWMTRVLIENQGLDAQASLGEDAAGEAVKPLQAACLLQNPGVVAALLEAQAFSGSVVDREFQLAARIASQHEDQGILALLMKYAQTRGELEWMMRALQDHGLQ
ncbi:MAG: hypothetical protein RBS36_03845 [Thiomicrospira sp.]|jgi:hypothetical protein|nr:hypothetical protein [Thiomicrospira sp.]